ncbi:MAG: carbon storage regulator [Alphaproteobacteria bacterium]|nr:carbon storage regulator [Alphaproteobacteria bacterium]MCB9791651.1 carbon storage regulator [Alphaproteobacteria bacterium]
MLVLTQKEGEILQVGEDVRIYIKRIKGNWVRLCIDAPREIELKRIPAPKGAQRQERPQRDMEESREGTRRVVRIAREG